MRFWASGQVEAGITLKITSEDMASCPYLLDIERATEPESPERLTQTKSQQLKLCPKP